VTSERTLVHHKSAATRLPMKQIPEPAIGATTQNHLRRSARLNAAPGVLAASMVADNPKTMSTTAPAINHGLRGPAYVNSVSSATWPSVGLGQQLCDRRGGMCALDWPP
jgi:hypothetical protein